MEIGHDNHPTQCVLISWTLPSKLKKSGHFCNFLVSQERVLIAFQFVGVLVSSLEETASKLYHIGGQFSEHNYVLEDNMYIGHVIGKASIESVCTWQ